MKRMIGGFILILCLLVLTLTVSVGGRVGWAFKSKSEIERKTYACSVEDAVAIVGSFLDLPDFYISVIGYPSWQKDDHCLPTQPCFRINITEYIDLMPKEKP